ncbi:MULTISPECIES: curlin [Aurantimonas]|uniref:curlin n=1 Tax=Aurantimonas TaxID=182269 RepID=UPI003511DF94
MTFISANAIAAALALAVVAPATFATPAAAGGQVSWTFAPNDRQTSGAVEAGLRIYSLYNGLKDGSIRQKGQGNNAGLAQRGRGNVGLVQQRGNGHSGTLEQNGDGNAYGLFQFGREARNAVVQSGNRNSGATFTYGW